MQNVSTVIRRPVPMGTAAASWLVAFAAGAVIALGLPVVAGLSTSHSSSATVSVGAVGGELIAHNRSEHGLDVSSPAGAEKIAHNRSEQGLP